MVMPHPQPLKRRLKQIKRLHRAVTRKPQGSHNRKKAARTLGKAYRAARNQRDNTRHQVTTRRAKTTSVIVIEDRHVAGMRHNHRLAHAIAEVGCAQLRRHLRYKAAWYGSRVVVVSRWEPSSTTCSAGGWYDADLTRADRTVRCERCGHIPDRDRNAASNVRTLAGSSSERQHACGEASAGLRRAAAVKLTPVKQEPNTSDASAEDGTFWRTERM
jgi:putative transposase